MAELLTSELPLTPPSGVTVAFQNADGTWPSSLDTYKIPTPPPCFNTLGRRCDLLEDESKHLRGSWLRSRKSILEIVETSKIVTTNLMKTIDRADQDRAMLHDMSDRLRRLESQLVIMDQRVEFIERRQTAIAPEPKRRRLYEDPWDGFGSN